MNRSPYRQPDRADDGGMRGDYINRDAAIEADPVMPSADEEPLFPSADEKPPVPSADEEPVVPSADEGPVV